MGKWPYSERGLTDEQVVWDCRINSYMKSVRGIAAMYLCGEDLTYRPAVVSHFTPRLSTIIDNWHEGETVSREISLRRKSHFALMPLRKVDFSHSRAPFDLLWPFVSLRFLPGELRWAKLVMMPQQASIFHHAVLPSDWSHLDNNRLIHCSSSLDWKLYI